MVASRITLDRLFVPGNASVRETIERLVERVKKESEL